MKFKIGDIVKTKKDLANFSSGSIGNLVGDFKIQGKIVWHVIIDGKMLAYPETDLEPVEHKFKIGDRVKAKKITHNESGQSEISYIYGFVINAVCTNQKTSFTLRGENDTFYYQFWETDLELTEPEKPNFQLEDGVELVSIESNNGTSQKFYMVKNLKQGSLYATEVHHATREEAEKEAQRLAKKHIGDYFAILISDSVYREPTAKEKLLDEIIEYQNWNPETIEKILNKYEIKYKKENK